MKRRGFFRALGLGLAAPAAAAVGASLPTIEAISEPAAEPVGEVHTVVKQGAGSDCDWTAMTTGIYCSSPPFRSDMVFDWETDR